MTQKILDRIRPLIEEIVDRKLRGLLDDPDAGRRVRPAVLAELRKRVQAADLRSAARVARRLGLQW